MLIKIATGFLVTVLILFSACSIAVLNAGVGSLHIENEELTLWLPVPMLAADLALHFAPAEALRDVREDLYPVKDVVLSTAHELADCPDATLVEVNTSGENVRVQKSGDDLIIHVNSRTEGKARLKLPIHSVERILRLLII